MESSKKIVMGEDGMYGEANIKQSVDNCLFVKVILMIMVIAGHSACFLGGIGLQ